MNSAPAAGPTHVRQSRSRAAGESLRLTAIAAAIFVVAGVAHRNHGKGPISGSGTRAG